MKRLMVFCGRDWLHPGAGDVERYVHEVCVRLAARGCYVAWVAHSFPLGCRVKRPRTEIVDGVQIARLGVKLLYRRMAGMLLTQLEKGRQESPFDAILDCITQHPLPIAEKTRVPVVPLVFELSRKVSASDEPPGPAIAATERAYGQLVRAGFPEDLVVDASVEPDGKSWERIAETVFATIEGVVR